MNFSDYIPLALRTKSEAFHQDHVPRWKAERFVYQILDNAKIMDEIKKGLFYGKDTPNLDRSNDTGYYSARAEWQDPDIVHGILGLFTESAELVEEMMFIELDREAVIDELGDLMWYMALVLSRLNVSMDEVLERNVKKLKKRYPEGFDTNKALVRN